MLGITADMHRDNLAVSLAAGVIAARQIKDVKDAAAVFNEMRARITVQSSQDADPPA